MFKFYQNAVEGYFTVEAKIEGKDVLYVDQEGQSARWTYRELNPFGAVGQQTLEALATRLMQLESGYTRAGG